MSPADPLPATEDYRGEPAAGGSPGRFRLALAGGPDVHSADELRPLLVRRLRIFTTLMAVPEGSGELVALPPGCGRPGW
jgi:hypothetical protein